MRRFPGAVVAGALDVIIGGHPRKQKKSTFAQLLGAAQNDLGAPIIVLDRSLDFDLTAFELANVAQFLEIGGEYDNSEGTRLLLAEVKQLDSVAAILHVDHGSDDTLGRADMLACLGQCHAVIGGRITRGTNCIRGEDCRG